MRELLAADDTAAGNLIQGLYGHVDSGKCQAHLRSLDLVVENYDFEMALDHLVELENLVKAHLTP